MMYPIYETAASPKLPIKAFFGINRKKKGRSGECVECRNVDGDEFPVLRSVRTPKKIHTAENIIKLIAPPDGDFRLSGIVGGEVVGFGEFKNAEDTVIYDTRTATDILKSGNALVTVPNFSVYNIDTKEITAKPTDDYAVYKKNGLDDVVNKNNKGYLWRYPLSEDKLPKRVKYIMIRSGRDYYYYKENDSGYLVIEDDASYENQMIYYKKTDTGYEQAENTELDAMDGLYANEAVLITEEEDISCACVWQNRVWGGSSDGRRIRCSKPGELNNFTDFDSGAASSWSCEVGSDGKFTGIIPFSNAIFAFKESHVHVVYGTAPSNFSQDKTFEGCGLIDKNSLVVAENSLFWLGHNGIYRYSGGKPKIISESLNKKYKSCVSFTDHKKVYFNLVDGDGEAEFLSFDIKNELWHRYDDANFIGGVLYGGKVYAYTENTVFELENGDFSEWSFDGVLEYNDDFSDCSVVEFYIRAELKNGSSVKLEFRGISESDWETLGGYTADKDEMIKEKFVARLKNDKAFLWRISGCGEAYIYEIEKTVPRSGKSFKRD